MIKKIGVARVLLLLIPLSFMLFMTVKPSICARAALRGLIACGETVIPSLFPFTVCVLFLMRCGLSDSFKFGRLTGKITGLGTKSSCVFLFSAIGGYPVGARLINELCEQGYIDEEGANRMLCFCVNSGPAFIVLAVGEGLLHSKSIGYILLLSSILSSVILMCLFGFKKIKEKTENRKEANSCYSECFVGAAASAAESMLSISAYIVFFSAARAFFEEVLPNWGALSVFKDMLEVTTALTNTKNVCYISFLLGFSGFCVWFQIFGSVKGFRIRLWLFALSRLLHGLLSAALTLLQIKLFHPTLETVSNGLAALHTVRENGIAIGCSLVLMVLLLIISAFNKKGYGNLREDIV